MSDIALSDGSVIEVERDYETRLVKLKFRTRFDDGTVSAMMASLKDEQRDALVLALEAA